MSTKYEQKKENKHNNKFNLLNDQYSLSLSLSIFPLSLPPSSLSLSDLIFVIFPQWPCFHFVI